MFRKVLLSHITAFSTTATSWECVWTTTTGYVWLLQQGMYLYRLPQQGAYVYRLSQHYYCNRVGLTCYHNREFLAILLQLISVACYDNRIHLTNYTAVYVSILPYLGAYTFSILHNKANLEYCHKRILDMA